MDSDVDGMGISPDEIDEALETLWKGRSGAFENLLQREGDGEAGVGSMFGGAVSTGLPAAATDETPSIAGYTVIRELGRGGMGVIYEARQHNPSRSVAVKVIRGGRLPDEQKTRLFEREIQSLARLKHPSVADIYEAGTTDDGRPFFAMELVSGTPLTQFIAELPIDARNQSDRVRMLLRMFDAICDAVSYAHQRGVIHRDLKPSNVLVAESGEGSGSGSAFDRGPRIKVVDFGLARMIDADVADPVTTEDGQIRGTIAYMAPEQIQGYPADIDTRCDVYALGILLFEMLTGQLPYDIKSSALGRSVQMICETPPTRPGTLNPALRGDLETIILKALSKSPDQRYATADALGDDIKRFLAGQPILARPQSAIYQLRKLVSRHRVASTAILAAVTVSILGFVVSAALYVRADRARQAEAKQRVVAQDVSRFLTQMLLSLDPRKAEGKNAALLRDLADQASQRIERELSELPVVKAALKNTLGQVYLALGMFDEAKRHLTESLSTFQLFHGDEHIATLGAAHNIGVLRQDQGRMDEAKTLLESVLERRQRVCGVDHPDTLATLNQLGVLNMEWHKLDRAESLLRDVVARRQEVLGDTHPDTLVSMNNLSNVLSKYHKYIEAEKMLRDLLVLQEATLPAGHLDILVSKNDLAVALKSQRKLDEAEPLYREVLAGFQETLGDGHLDTLITMNNLAGLLFNRGALEESANLSRKMVGEAENHLPVDSYYTAVFRGGYGRSLMALKHYAEAQRQLKRSTDDLRTALGAEHVYTRLYSDLLLELYRETGQLGKAAQLRELP